MATIDRERLGAIGLELSNYASDLQKFLNSWRPPGEFAPVEGWSDPIRGTYSRRSQDLWWKYAVPCGNLLISALRAGAFLLEDPKLRQRLLSHFGSLRQHHSEWFAAAKAFVYGAEFWWSRSTRSVRKYKEESYFWAVTFPGFLQLLIVVVGRE